MPLVELENSSLRFDEFCLDRSARRLSRSGQPVRIQDQPLQMLMVLLETPGEVVSREELRRRLWPEGTFVDFDNSMNAAMNKLREALGDSADTPRFVETLPRRGYRFICPVKPTDGADGANGNGHSHAEAIEVVVASEPEVFAPAQQEAPPAPRKPFLASRRFWLGVLVGLSVVLFLGAAYFVWQRLLASPVPRAQVSLAVLPFKNLSGDPAQDVFTDGLTEEMITQLGSLQSDQVSVAASSAVIPYKNSSLDMAGIGRELGVNYILEGGVRREGNRLRITTQLVHVEDQLQVFAQTYESTVGNLLDVQQDVAARIARALEYELLPSAAAPNTSATPAVDAYMHGRYFWNKRTEEGVRKALDYFQQAIAADPTYAPAYAGVADAYVIWGGRLLGTPPDEAYARARTAAQKALALDPDLAEAHATLAAIRFEHDWDFPAADREFQRAIELKPDYAIAHQWYAEYLSSMGRHPEALVEINHALKLDPFSRSVNLACGEILMYARDYDAAIAQFRKLVEMEPDFREPYAYLNRIYLQKGMTREFAQYFLEWAARSGFATEELRGYRSAYEQGDLKGLLRERKRVLLLQADTYYRAPYIVARIHALLGEHDQALQWLEKAMLQRDDFITHVTVDPEFDSLRSDPRFQQLLKRIGLP